MPVVGFLRSRRSPTRAHLVAAFRQGLKEAGFVAGQNVAVEFRSGRRPDSIGCRLCAMISFAGRSP